VTAKSGTPRKVEAALLVGVGGADVERRARSRASVVSTPSGDGQLDLDRLTSTPSSSTLLPASRMTPVEVDGPGVADHGRLRGVLALGGGRRLRLGLGGEGVLGGHLLDDDVEGEVLLVLDRHRGGLVVELGGAEDELGDGAHGGPVEVLTRRLQHAHRRHQALAVDVDAQDDHTLAPLGPRSLGVDGLDGLQKLGRLGQLPRLALFGLPVELFLLEVGRLLLELCPRGGRQRGHQQREGRPHRGGKRAGAGGAPARATGAWRH
jgi:hypothetical protein